MPPPSLAAILSTDSRVVMAVGIGRRLHHIGESYSQALLDLTSKQKYIGTNLLFLFTQNAVECMLRIEQRRRHNTVPSNNNAVSFLFSFFVF